MEYRRRRILLGSIVLAVLAGMFILPGTKLPGYDKNGQDFNAFDYWRPELYHFRTIALLILAAGLLAYLFLGRFGKSGARDVAYPAWRMMLGDLASLLVFCPFFILPFLMSGGTLQLFASESRLFFAGFWLFAIAGILLMQMIARMASLRIRIRQDGLEYTNPAGKKVIPFEAIDFAFPMQYRPSSKVVAGATLASLLGEGRGLGGAILLAFSESQGLGIQLKDGAVLHFWLTDQLGTKALRNATALFEALVEAKIPFKDEARVFKSLNDPIESGTAAKPPRLVPLILMALPFLLIIVMEAIASMR